MQYVVTYITPLPGNEPALGLDLASETVRREGAEAARDTGEPRMTSQIRLVQNRENRPGFLLFLPVYRRGAVVTTVDERRAALKAWVDVPFVVGHFLQGVLGNRSRKLRFYVFEQGSPDQAHLLYASETIGATLPSFERMTSLDLAGQKFTLGWVRGPDFVPSAQSPIAWLAIGLAVGTAVLAGWVRSLRLFHERAEALVVIRTAALKKVQEQFLQAQKMEAVGLLAGGVAHDFNNILASVLMYLGLLQENPSTDPGTLASLKELEKDVHRGAALVRQLLAFSRRQAMEPKVLDLRELIQGLSKMLRRLLGEHITLSVQASDGLPPVQADAGMIEQVVMNLCINARDAMPRGGKLSLRLDAIDIGADAAAANGNAREGRFLRLSVADTGCGMDEPTLRRVFEPFFTTKGIGKGTGLGLATAYGIVKQHGGWIEVQSEVGLGSTFHVYLPACAGTADATPKGAAPRPKSGCDETVLVVEDEDGLRALTVIALRRQGYRVLEAVDGQDALRVWQDHRDEVDLLFTDMVMHGEITGRELAGQLRADRPDLKVLICTGYSQDPGLQDPDAMRISVLRKPFTIGVLAQVVRQCLDAS